MLKNHPPKGLNPAELLRQLLQYRSDVRQAQSLALHIFFFLCAFTPTRPQADTIYRCGEAYSTSNQCGHTQAIEVKPGSVPRSPEQGKHNTAAQDLRDAQALEKQRLQAERQAAQSTPTRLNTPSAAPANSPNEAPANNTKRYGHHSRQLQSPYFTAVDPKATSQKKSTAKAVPATSTSNP